MDTIACGYPSLLLSHLSLSGNKSHFNGLQKPLPPLIEGTCSQSLIFFEAFLPSSSEKVNFFEIRALFLYSLPLALFRFCVLANRKDRDGLLTKSSSIFEGKEANNFQFHLAF